MSVTWKDLRTRFELLASEERSFVQQVRDATGKKDDLYMYAYCGLEPDREELLIKAGPPFSWKLGGGLNESFSERVRTLTTEAGIALGSPSSTDPLTFWLRNLYEDVRQGRSPHLFEQHMVEQSQEGGAILRICEASATYCSKLEKKALTECGKLDERASLKLVLEKRGWSIHDWARHAKVDFHTADNYLKRKTTKLYPDTRKKLADALDLPADKLPE